jgi:hypothetical protein
MSEPQVRLSFDGDRGAYCPGNVLSGTWSIERVAENELKAIELSVLWHTEGKGDEDLTVHHFERVAPEDALQSARSPKVFSVHLPNSPLSYDGLVVKIRWCVRVRVFLQRGRELVVDLPFRLGTVPSPPVPLATQQPAADHPPAGSSDGKQ